MHKNFSQKFSEFLDQEKDSLWLWIPVFIACGIIFFFTLFNQNPSFVIAAAVIFIIALALFYCDRLSYRSFIYLACGLMLFGFLWAFFYQKFFVTDVKLTGRVFANVKGEVADIKRFRNVINGHEGLSLVLSDLTLYKSKFVAKQKIVKISKQKKTAAKIKKPSKRFLKFSKECDGEAVCIVQKEKEFSEIKEQKKQEREAKEKQPSKKFLKLAVKCGEDAICLQELTQQFEKIKEEKRQKKAEKKRIKAEELALKKAAAKKIKEEKILAKKQKTLDKKIEKNFLNLSDRQEIDRKFLDFRTNYQQVQWLQRGDYEIFPNPPRKIILMSYSQNHEIKIGDVIYLRAAIGPPEKKEFFGEFDYGMDADSKGIGGFGYGMGEIAILKKSPELYNNHFIDNLRKIIEKRITNEISGDQGAIAAALMMGNQNLISKTTMNEIRNAGLAHLLSISGLHLSLAAAIFFMSLRFILSRSEYLTLRYDIKKIAAIMAIFGAYFYLELADAPVPAVRSFIAVALVLLAILIDRKSDAKRCVALAAFFILLGNPYNIFSVSFQLSFAAILALVCLHQFMSQLKFKLEITSMITKFLWYFFEIILASIVVEITTMPFLIYHFNNFSTYGLLSNMVAIPLTSFITMPLGFLSILLMPLGLEKFTLYLMGASITWVLEICHFVANLKYAYLTTMPMPKSAFVLAAFGFVVTCLINHKVRWVGALIIVASCSSIFFVKPPDLLFDAEQKFFAIYNSKDGLVFSKEIRPSKKRDLWMKNMHENQFKYLGQYSKEWRVSRGIYCDDRNCKITMRDQKILILLQRNKLSEICPKADSDFNIIVNLTARYAMPDCFAKDKIKIDNLDFYQKGGQAIYLEQGKARIETVR